MYAVIALQIERQYAGISIQISIALTRDGKLNSTMLAREGN